MRLYRGRTKQLVKTPEMLNSFWRRVPVTDGCWEWNGQKHKTGYGIFDWKGCPYLAHRVSYWLRHGEMPELCVLHRCDNPVCVRPGHLFLGTRPDNSRDMCLKLRQSKKLTADAVKEIRARGKAGETFAGLAREFGVSGEAVSKICRGENWKYLGE